MDWRGPVPSLLVSVMQRAWYLAGCSKKPRYRQPGIPNAGRKDQALALAATRIGSRAKSSSSASGSLHWQRPFPPAPGWSEDRGSWFVVALRRHHESAVRTSQRPVELTAPGSASGLLSIPPLASIRVPLYLSAYGFVIMEQGRQPAALRFCLNEAAPTVQARRCLIRIHGRDPVD